MELQVRLKEKEKYCIYKKTNKNQSTAQDVKTFPSKKKGMIDILKRKEQHGKINVTFLARINK